MNQYKYLGITLDNKLSIEFHAQEVADNVNTRAKKLISKIYELDTSVRIIWW